MTAPARQPWLSVIMPTHAGEDWIDASLESLVAHGAPGIEVIVLDSSPDAATLDRVARFRDRLDLRAIDPQGLVMWHEKTNAGTRAARADHVCWLHQDDLWLPGRASALRRWIKADPAAVLHIANSVIVDRDGRSMGVWKCPFAAAAEGRIDPDVLLQRLLVQNFVATPSPVYRRDAFLAVGGLDESLWYTADWDLWLKFQGAGPVAFHPEATAGFRIHGNSLTVSGSRSPDDFRQQMRTVLDRHLPRLQRHQAQVGRAGQASIEVNTALAAASAGNLQEVTKAARALLRLTPANWVRFLRDTRLADRLIPRVRARLAGAF